MSRLCRSGRTIRDIEKILADHEALVQEADLLRVQKRKALEEAHKYRTSYEQIKTAEEVLGVEQETRRAVERTTELERLLAEMTDYIHAKEMQLETMKEVNQTLQDEIHNLAKANLRKNEV
jgi:phage regulator Rha-like protein